MVTAKDIRHAVLAKSERCFVAVVRLLLIERRELPLNESNI